MISTSYDPEADAFYVRIAPKGTPVAETREVDTSNNPSVGVLIQAR